ncbi:hypothetical protein SAMN02745247_03042 [Butyrivibrio hungatei DSM 14810]|uniref:Glucosyl transferase GtrII n=1 Tax=Butyrivibrio hungatei DSM 14810 TaxID=1121132 RepID=A0A1M7T5E1_9FIRM|nr:hypothetical protein [Butyrivibrio hungatei]SHN65906.1 hypothetical protein SAMN02745247_03042 [Butyrivibrio hungatei DSM 14810]
MKNKINAIISNIIIFGFLVIFFSCITPLIAYNCDDWIYLGKIRLPIPLWGGWNPTRVFFETVMPIMGRVAGYIIYPIVGDFVFSITLGSAILLSFLIAVMCISMYNLLINRFKFGEVQALESEIFFLALFFLIFRTRSESNYMFCAEDLCCVYNYTMPGVINAIVVLTIARYEGFANAFKRFDLVRKGAFLFVLYFALLSNIFHSIITVSYCMALILHEIVSEKKDKENSIKRLYKNTSIYFWIIVSWIIVLFFEKSGGRAGTFQHKFNLVQSVTQFKAILFALSKPFLVLVAVTFAGLIWRNMRKMKEGRSVVICFVVAMFGVLIYLLLLNSLIGYMSRVDASWGIWFYLISICSLMISNTIANIKHSRLIMAIMLFTVMLCCYYPDGRYMISSSRNRDYELCYKTSKYYVDSIIEARLEGKEIVEIAIPEVEVNDEKNLTYYYGFGDIVSNTLYFNGIIDERVTVQEKVDSSLNEEFLGVR